MLTTIITHALALLLGAGGGWYLKGRYGATADKIVTDVRTPSKP